MLQDEAGSIFPAYSHVGVTRVCWEGKARTLALVSQEQ
jgi:hypothetical protein